MTLSDKLALQLRLAKAYRNFDNVDITDRTCVHKTTVAKYCNGDLGRVVASYDKCLNALGFELEIKLRRLEREGGSL